MGMIYQDAYVVIAADRAFNTDAGFLQHRDVSSRTLAPLSDAEESVVPPLVLENHDELHTIHSHFDTRNIMSVMNSMSISNPVFQRGWCLQERLLATRVLHVTAQELVWECRTTIDCECGRLEEVALNGFPTLRGNFGTLYANEAEETSNTVVHILLRNWHYIVQWYSGCDLSFAQDRLLAVSGVARRLQLPVFGQYLAGLWECELPQELAWRSIHDKTSTKYNTRDQVYVAPTWSWASVKGQVEWQDDEMTKVLINFAEVISVHCEPLDMDIFGCLQAGRLTLRTPVLKPLPRPPRKRGYYETTPPPVPNRIDCSLAIVPGRWEDISINAEIMLDVDQLSNSEQNESVDLDSILLAFLHCQSTAVHGGWRLEWRALAISPDPELQGVYRRVGLACSDYDPDVLKEGQKLSEWNGHETLPLAIDEVIPSALPEPAEDIAELENYLKGKQEQDDSPRPRRSPSLPPHLKTTATTRTTIGRKPFHSHIVNPHHALSDLKNMGALLRTITIM
ncbi:hypothetical protein H2198_001875 [Neophaeococcomyces mojaviensis]|uniref:Uncharacterized protein n=1 Tax=Neophaeococcomyces mojaviensis TaxID=3383035 RepID=A0ACC3AFL8_9EURO|nr:hypothetical protein H2198_001875 [Knufia sp. JES_112]